MNYVFQRVWVFIQKIKGWASGLVSTFSSIKAVGTQFWYIPNVFQGLKELAQVYALYTIASFNWIIMISNSSRDCYKTQFTELTVSWEPIYFLPYSIIADSAPLDLGQRGWTRRECTLIERGPDEEFCHLFVETYFTCAQVTITCQNSTSMELSLMVTFYWQQL